MTRSADTDTRALAGRLGTAGLRLSDRDTMRWVTFFTAGGIVLAFVLAINGGMPFDIPMPTHALGIVEPSCGLTRGSTAIARGDFAIAWRYNPASFLVMGFGVAGIARTAVGLLTRRWVEVRVKPSRMGWVLVLVVVVAFTVYQQTNAEFIIHSRI